MIVEELKNIRGENRPIFNTDPCYNSNSSLGLEKCLNVSGHASLNENEEASYPSTNCHRWCNTQIDITLLENGREHPPTSKRRDGRPAMRLRRGRARLGWVRSGWPQSPHAPRCPSCSVHLGFATAIHQPNNLAIQKSTLNSLAYPSSKSLSSQNQQGSGTLRQTVYNPRCTHRLIIPILNVLQRLLYLLAD